MGENPDALLAKLDGCPVAGFKRGHYICREGEYDENCYIILEGSASVKLPRKGADRQKKIVLRQGEVFGEIAFLLETPRTADVFAATDDVRILSLSERTLRASISSESEIAATLLLNISKILCRRVLKG